MCITRKRSYYYFGGEGKPGLLDLLLPRLTVPAIFAAWKRHALGLAKDADFERCATEKRVSAAVGELDDLVSDVFERHFGDPRLDAVRRSYLRAMHRFGTDTLPAADERLERIGPGDPRRRTAGRHTIDVDMMWFAWALQLEAPQLGPSDDRRTSLRALLLAGVATGSSANFAWRRHRRTRRNTTLMRQPSASSSSGALGWAEKVTAATAEVHQLYQIREWGCRSGGWYQPTRRLLMGMVQPIALRPGAAASFQVRYLENPRSRPCQKVATVHHIPPNSTSQIVVAVDGGQYCPTSGVGVSATRPVNVPRSEAPAS